MSMPPIEKCKKGRLRWNIHARQWDWVCTGPCLSVVVLRSGAFKVNRVKL